VLSEELTAPHKPVDVMMHSLQKHLLFGYGCLYSRPY